MQSLASQSGDAGAICNFRKLCSSFANPAEHVGEQIDGSGSCRASVGSGGIAGDCGASQRVCVGVHPAKLSASASSITSRGFGLFRCIITGFLHSSDTPPLFVSHRLYGSHSRLGICFPRLSILTLEVRNLSAKPPALSLPGSATSD